MTAVVLLLGCAGGGASTERIDDSGAHADARNEADAAADTPTIGGESVDPWANCKERAWAAPPDDGDGYLHTYEGGDTQTTLLPDGRVLLAAGVSIYDPKANRYQKLAGGDASRVGAGITLLADRHSVLISGGGISDPSAGSEIVDTSTGTRRRVAPLLTALYGHFQTLLPNGKVLVVGGSTYNTFSPSVAAELFDPVTETWTRSHTPPGFLREGEIETFRDYSKSIALADGDVLTTDESCLWFLYDYRHDEWRLTIPNPRRHPAFWGVQLQDGRLLMGGEPLCPGGDITKRQQASSDIFDPRTETWSSGVELPVSIDLMNAHLTVLPCGDVILFATNDDGHVEQILYDPPRNRWFRLPSAFPQRWESNRSVSAMLLLDGRVMAMAGQVYATESVWNGPMFFAELAGHSVTLTYHTHDDNHAADATYALFDNAALN